MTETNTSFLGLTSLKLVYCIFFKQQIIQIIEIRTCSAPRIPVWNISNNQFSMAPSSAAVKL